jgi:hypothetical protein
LLEGVGLSAKRGLAARGLHEALISRNRSQPQGYGNPAADRLRGGQHQNAWALPYTAVEV